MISSDQTKIKNRRPYLIIIILIWLGCWLTVPINLINSSDLGRHIKNGELILNGTWEVLYKNYYSYTNPEHSFTNHHWLFGVFCYILWHYLGFEGLSFIYLLLELFTFYVFFRLAQRYSSFTLACAFGLLSFPLICLRSEVRPEGITALLGGLFWLLIDSYQRGQLKSQPLCIGLCVLQIIWVNSHIFFILGPVLTIIFCLQARLNGEKEQAKVLQNLFFLLWGMCLINPSGIKGILAPFTVDKSFYLFPTEESLSIFHFFNDAYLRPFVLYFLATLCILGVILAFLIKRDGIKKYIFIGFLTLFFAFPVMMAERMVGIYGLVWIPLSAYVYQRWLNLETSRIKKNIKILLITTGIIVSISINSNWNQPHGLGIIHGSNDAAEFFKKENIDGPIFNNIDIGSYLIFHLSPRYKVFVDNRVQPYPVDFMETLRQMQLNDALWHQLDQKYHFNVIFIFPEYTREGITFIKHRLDDPAWALVYGGNNDAMIFLKRNLKNAPVIDRHEIKRIRLSFSGRT